MATKFGRRSGRNRGWNADEPARVAKEPGSDESYAAGVPLAKLVRRALVSGPELVVHANPRSYAAEKFRRLRSMVFAEVEQSPKVVVITSPAPGEGKSLIAMNLALAAARSGDEKVLLVDGDLRRPTVSRWINPKPSLGLAELLAKDVGWEHAVLSLEGSALNLLPAGQPLAEPGDLLGSKKMKNLVELLRERFDRIIVDMPPIVPFTDADLVGAFSDGVVLVARAGRTTVAMLRQAEGLVASAPVLGVVLNEQTGGVADHGYRYESYYRDYYAEDRKS